MKHPHRTEIKLASNVVVSFRGRWNAIRLEHSHWICSAFVAFRVCI